MSTAQATAETPATAAPAADKPATVTITVYKMPFKFKLLLIVSCITMMVFLRTGFIFVVLAMLPAIVMYFADRAKRRHMFKSVFAMNLSGTLPFIGTMLKDGPMTTLLPIMQSVDTWLIIYGAAMCGYLMVTSFPIVAHAMFANLHGNQVERIEEKLRAIEREWGEEVGKFSARSDKAED